MCRENSHMLRSRHRNRAFEVLLPELTYGARNLVAANSKKDGSVRTCETSAKPSAHGARVSEPARRSIHQEAAVDVCAEQVLFAECARGTY